ncbi:unnamed protein product [Ectocarpus sp. 12 AP-2014]
MPHTSPSRVPSSLLLLLFVWLFFSVSSSIVFFVRPFPNLLQLLSVLPPQSADFLPGPYKALMVEPTSPILEYYPTEFECDANGKTASWETVVKIPFIDEKDVFGALSNVDHTKDLEAVDRLRNYTGKVWQFLPQFRLTPTGEPTNPVPQPAGKVRDSKK